MHIVNRTRSRRDTHAWRCEGGLKLAPVKEIKDPRQNKQRWHIAKSAKMQKKRKR